MKGAALDLANRLRRRRRAADQIVGWLDDVARRLRAGSGFGPAVLAAADDAPAELRTQMNAMRAHLRAGADPISAIDSWSAADGSAAARMTADAMAVAVSAGGASARAIDSVAATLREHRAIDADVDALGAQARLSALVMGVAPFGFLAVTAAADSRSIEFLVGTPLGRLVAVAGITLNGLGAWWMRRLADGSRR